MGCGGSTSANSGKPGGKREGKKGNEEPELNGKVKFLSCPSVCEITHQETKHRYFLIAFAPQTHHGLIIAARNSTTGVVLVKEVTDAELMKEKEAQGITLSWNLFFKAVSTEVGKANKSGAKYEVLPTGSLKLEIKISIAGTQTNKKVDSYTAELKKVEATDANLYRLFMEPIATFYGKKRTDLLDRPDPVREKQYGECEANAIIKSASISRCKKTIDETLPQLSPLRDSYRALSAEAHEKRCKINLMRAMVQEKTTTPMILKPLNMKVIGIEKTPQDADSATIKFTSHLEPNLFSGLSKVSLRHKSTEDAILKPIEDLIMSSVQPLQLGAFKSDEPVCPEIPNNSQELWVHFTNFDGKNFDAFNGKELHEKSGGHSLYLVTLFMLQRYGLLGANPPAAKTFEKDATATEAYPGFKFPELDQVKNYCYVIEAIYNAQRTNSANKGCFHTTVKATMSMRALHFMLYPGGMWTRLRLTPAELFLTIIACLVHDADHPGVNNAYMNTSRTFLSCLYGVRSPLERHHVAVALEVASVETCHIDLQDHLMKNELCQMVLGTDLGQHAECSTKFTRRAAAISDWSRMHDDRITCAGMLIKLSDSFYCFSASAWYQPFAEAVREEFYQQGDLHKANPAISGTVQLQESMDRRKSDTDSWLKGHGTFGYYVVLPMLSTLAEISPALEELHRNCSENCS